MKLEYKNFVNYAHRGASEYAPEFKAGYLVNEPVTNEILTKMKEHGITELWPRATVITKEKVKEWNKKGFELRAWGVSNTDIMKQVFDTGINGMTVNFPDKLTEYYKENVNK